MQAAEEGLTEPYKSPKLAELQDWAVRQAEQSKYRTVGIYAGALGYSYNTDELKKRKLPEPKCWADLTTPAFKDEVQVANPNSSGTSYTMLATLVQIMGEAKAFDYLKALHKNVNQYTKSGAAPARAAATGESLVGITFQHDAVIQALGGAPVKIVSPCEGTGYEIGSMSIVKGAKNMANAKLWYDWALSTEGQAIGAANKVSYQVPSNKAAPVPAAAPRLADIKRINYDFAKYGSSAERKRLLGKWDAEVSTLPK
jgi:iron(III) transport system substrate-binding protein